MRTFSYNYEEKMASYFTKDKLGDNMRKEKSKGQEDF